MKSLFESLSTTILGCLIVALVLLVNSQAWLPVSHASAALVAETAATVETLSTELPHVGPAAPLAATSAARTEARSFWSASLQRAMPYLVHLPAGYDSNPNARYPVLYMLHGRGGNYRFWQDLGLSDMADKMVESGEIQPFIVIMPEGGDEYWVNHADNGPRWGDYIGRDLVAETDSQFRTLANRLDRAVGGISMGGCGALQLGINYSDVFSIIGAHSPALRTHDIAPEYFGDQAFFDAHSPVPLFKARPKVAQSLKIWIDMGGQDTWHDPALAFHKQLQAEGIAHQWTEQAGGHDGNYWTGHLADYLRYYDSALRSSSVKLAASSIPALSLPELFTSPLSQIE